jgi:hypothetical protein
VTTDDSDQPKHDEVEQYSRSESSQEPASSDFNILVSIRESIEVKMVDATALNDYEIWFTFAGVDLSAFTGFLIATMQATDRLVAQALGGASVLFGAIFVVGLVMTLVKRHSFHKRGRVVKLRASRDQIERSRERTGAIVRSAHLDHSGLPKS